jgi:glycosyltransferase involved in cell wall biosynthesis
VKLLCPPQARICAEAANWGVPAIPLPIDRKRPVGLGALHHWFTGNVSDIINTHSSTDSWLAALVQAGIGRPTRIVRTRHISAPVPRGLLSRWLYMRAASYVVTTGEAIKRQLVERNGFRANRIESVPTGQDAGRYRPGDKQAARGTLGLPAQATLIGIVATLRSWKGHRYLLEALPQGATLVVVGDGPQREALTAQAASLGIADRVRFAGNQRDVVPWLQSLDVFALPSYANEGVPQALVQAMLAGLPCVTTHVGSIDELAIDGETALVVPPQDVRALRQALERLLADAGLRAKLGEAARRHCEERMSYERMLDRMEAIYRDAARAYLER